MDQHSVRRYSQRFPVNLVEYVLNDKINLHIPMIETDPTARILQLDKLTPLQAIG
jgi:hypothetical protein